MRKSQRIIIGYHHSRRWYSRLVIFLVCSFCACASAGENSWIEKKAASDITVHVREADNSPFHVIQGKTVVAANLATLVSFLQDEDINTQWVPYSGGAKLLDQVSPMRSIVHFQVKASWPFKSRDAIAAFEISQNPETKVLTISMENLPGYIPKQKNVVRMPSYGGYWKLTPIDSQMTEVVYQNHIDPGGNIPGWIANSFAVKTTWQALSNLKEQIAGYQNIAERLAFIKEYEE